MKLDKFSNQAVVRLLREVAAAHEAKGEGFFTVRAYDNAADSVEHLTTSIRDLWEQGRLAEVPGFGQSLSEYLNEFFKTGKVEHFDEVKSGLPSGMFEILGLPRVGSKTAFKLAAGLGLKKGSAVADLEKYCRAGRVRSLEGFGEQSEKDLLEGILAAQRTDPGRTRIDRAFTVAGRVINYLSKVKGVERADPLGSLRRFVPTVGDIDIAVSSRNRKLVIQAFTSFPEVGEVLWSGENKATVRLKSGLQVDLMVKDPPAYGSLLQHFTGSKSHNIKLRELAIKKGLSLSEHGVKKRGSPKQMKFASEQAFYHYLGLEYIPPELREDQGEIEAAQKSQLTELVELTDIKGDLQVHSNWSLDGRNSVAELSEVGEKLNYQYLGITDHQLSLDKLKVSEVKSEIKKRKRIIDKINYSNNKFRVLNGIELLIRADGPLSYTNELLTEFDFVLVAIHSGFSQDRKNNTSRIIDALKNPYVTALAHPTGRLINQRESIEADWEAVFKICAQEGKFLEINGAPERLDLPDILIKQAKSFGVKFLVNTDAHSLSQLKNMLYGVKMARRGWLSPADVINTLTFDKLKVALGIK